VTNYNHAKICADRLQAIAEPSRIRIIECLLGGPRNVTELAKLVQAEIVNTSHHLGVLRSAGLVLDKKDGRFVIYSLNPELFKMTKTSTFLDLTWCRIEIEGK